MRRELETVLWEWRALAQTACLYGFIGDSRHIIELLKPRLAASIRRHGCHACDKVCGVVTGNPDDERQKYRSEAERCKHDECSIR